MQPSRDGRMIDNRSRNLRIDRLRGVSILLVVLLHYRIFRPIDFWPYFSDWPFMKNGSYGVTIFFVISGFLITSMSLQRWGEPGQIRPLDFYRTRMARIGPGILLLLAALWVLNLFGVPPFAVPPDRSILTATWYVLTFQYYNVAIPNNVPGMFSWTSIWSLSVEETFYLAFPLVCLVLRTRLVLGFVLAALVVIGPVAHLYSHYHTLTHSIDALAGGGLVAIITSYRKFSVPLGFVLRAVGAVLMMAALTFLDTSTDFYWATVVVVGAGAYLAGSASAPQPVTRADGLLRRCGRLSYEIYLFHVPVILLVSLLPSLQSAWAQALEFIVVMAVLILFCQIVAVAVTEPLDRKLRPKRRRKWSIDDLALAIRTRRLDHS